MTENEFLEGQAGLVYNLALRLTGNASDAEDLAQDALLRCLKALSGFRGESSASTWAYRITVNTWKNRVRSEKRRGFWKTVSMGFIGDDGEEEQRDFKADEPAVDAGLETSEAGEQVQKALLEIDEESRAIIVLRDIQDQPYEEIAKALDLPLGTVKSRLSRARSALKDKLKNKVSS